MVVQVIEGRYTVDYDVLATYLKAIFEKSPFEIIHPEESHEKWKVNVPRELTRDEMVELQRRFAGAQNGAGA